MRTGRTRVAAIAAVLVAAAVLTPIGRTVERAAASAPICEYVPPTTTVSGTAEVDCLPAPEDCALGRAPALAVLRTDPAATAACDGGGGSIRYYLAGRSPDARGRQCVISVRDDGASLRSTRNNEWFDPNECTRNIVGHLGRRFQPGPSGTLGVVATVAPAATEAALQVLRRGGNAIDAAVAAVFAVGVVSPQNCGIGGGGFLISRSGAGEVHALDFRETAPAAMTSSDQLFVGGAVDEGSGPRVVGVPGTVAGMSEALRKLGTLRLREVLQPAIALAESSIVTQDLANGYRSPAGHDALEQDRLRAEGAHKSDVAQIYLRNGIGLVPGATLEQPDHAASLQELAKYGPRAFYEVDHPGTIAETLADYMEESRGGATAEQAATADARNHRAGLMTAEDLRNYRPVWRKPLRSTYRGRELFFMPAPDAGGIQLAEMLNILEGYDMHGTKNFGSVDWAHAVIEAHKIAAADRDAHVGDPAFVDVPTEALLSKSYAAARRTEIDSWDGFAGTYAAGNFGSGSAGASQAGRSGSHTTHVSVIDRTGHAVSVTCTIERVFGSAVVVPGTGFLLNNQLTDFSRGSGAGPNEVEPRKRPRSNMTPFILVRGGEAQLVGGGAGGGTIPAGALHAVLNVVDYGMSISRAVDAPRAWADWSTGLVTRKANIEPARLPGVADGLRARGHGVDTGGHGGYEEYRPVPIMQLVSSIGGTRSAASDPRGLSVGPGVE